MAFNTFPRHYSSMREGLPLSIPLLLNHCMTAYSI
jgi:hypothetical protein